jgi:hypothetical protein
MSIMIGSDRKVTVRKGTAVKLPTNLQSQVEKAFDAQAQKKYWENEFNATRDELVIALDDANYFDTGPLVVTTRGTIAIQQRSNNTPNIDKIAEALAAGRMTTDQLLRCVVKVDIDKLEAFVGPGYINVLPPTKFAVLRPGVAVKEKLKVAK